MKLLPSATDISLHAWEVPLVTLVAALLPAAGIFIWATFFRKRGRPRRRKRRTYPEPNRAVARANGTQPSRAQTNGAAPAFDAEHAPGEPKS